MGFKRKGPRRVKTNWTQIPRENESWETYYKAQGLIPESEFPAFKAAFQRDLPLTFRITGTRQHALDVRQMLEQKYLPNLKGIEWEGEVVEEPKPIAFYPDNLGWQVSVGKQVIRKNPPFAHFQRFLVVETAVGNLSRQEAVSMIPPLLLDVKPHHTVLDTCASPGSKTVQIIEALHQEGDQPTGFVIANDADYKRSHMLTHQIKRLNSANVIVVNHDAQQFPRIKLPNNKVLKFDRILCDVPCSGDATMRKNLNVWKEWTVGNGLGLHQLQLNIAVRAVQMLKPGGKLVYSTCSLNPIEDEAVLAQILRQFPEMSLLDVSDQLPNLIRSPGVSDWKVQAKDKSWQDPNESGMNRSFFPPSEEEAKRFNLDRAVRVNPHQQDTGGFFIAVLVKKGGEAAEEPAQKRQKLETPDVPEPAPAAEAVAEVPTGDGSEPAENKSKRMPRDAVDEPFHFLDPNHPEVESCWKFYDINDDFHRDTLVVRNQTGEPVRSIYYVAPSVRPVIELNYGKVKFIHSGIKMFTHQKNQGECRWRVQSEGIEMLYRFVGPKRVVKSNKLEILRFLSEQAYPRFNDIQERDEELYKQVSELTEGCCFFEVGGVVYPLWRGRASINTMVSKENTEELLLRLFNVDRGTKSHDKPQNNKPEAEAETEAETEAAETEAAETEASEADAKTE